jgi:UDP-4-amino-4-deoxy-L-arabinose formyltransferase/UDP-glucuronic acid dehydrogenase (UDP-4-keto-hexauronic acid decarboxylating)
MQYVEARAFYGSGYQDVQHRRPSIREARSILGWAPEVPFEQSVNKTLDYFLNDVVGCATEGSCAMSACV